jgi:hypothetical protein
MLTLTELLYLPFYNSKLTDVICQEKNYHVIIYHNINLQADKK